MNGFYKKIVTEPKKDAGEKRPFSSYVRGIFLFVFFCSILLVAFYNIGTFVNSVISKWDEIKFAYEEHEIVSQVRDDYIKEQSELKSSFLRTEKSSEEQLIDAVVEKLQEEQSFR